MTLFGLIKKRIQVYIFSKKQRRFKRPPRVTSFETARSIGILFDYNKADDRDFVVDFAEKLVGNHKKVLVLGFYTSKKDSNYVDPESFFPKIVPQICSAKDFGLRSLFKTGALKRFATNDFDLLVDLTPKRYYLAKILVGLSSSKFKAGFYEDTIENVFDLMIRESTEASTRDKLQHLAHYLTIINPTQNEK